MLNKINHLWIRNESFHVLNAALSSHAAFYIIHLVFPVSWYILLFELSVPHILMKSVWGNKMTLSWMLKDLTIVSDLLQLVLCLENPFSHLSIRKMYNMVFKSLKLYDFWFLSRALPLDNLFWKNGSFPHLKKKFMLTSILIMSPFVYFLLRAALKINKIICSKYSSIIYLLF